LKKYTFRIHDVTGVGFKLNYWFIYEMKWWTNCDCIFQWK